jgi:drug/metabolite transporter (DMT)-like permease
LTAKAISVESAPRHTTWALIALFCVLWSSAFAAAKIALHDCPPLTLLTIRFFIAGALMLAWSAATRSLPRMRPREVLQLALLGILNSGLYLALSWSGMKTVSSAFAAILISSNPLLIGVLAGPLLGERMDARKLVGLCLGLAGVVIVLHSRLSNLSGGMHEDVRGTLLVAGGLLSLVAGTLAFKRFKPAAPIWTATGVQSVAAGAAVLPFAWHGESLAQIQLTHSLFWSMSYSIVAVSIGGYALWFTILSRNSATSASALHFLMPPLGLFFGWLVLGEAVSWPDMLGIVPIAIGIWLVTRG